MWVSGSYGRISSNTYSKLVFKALVEQSPFFTEEDQPPKVTERPVHITFHGVVSAPKRKLIRLGKEQENHQPGDTKTGSRGIKRERQVYVPPTVKRTGEMFFVIETVLKHVFSYC